MKIKPVVNAALGISAETLYAFIIMLAAFLICAIFSY